MNDEPLVDVKAAAEYLSVSTKTVRRMVTSGELEARRVGHQLRFEPRTLREHNSRPVATARSTSRGDFRSALAALTYDAA